MQRESERHATAWARQMLHQGFEVDSHDYDGRTALMLACAKGHEDIVTVLLAAGADSKKRDNLGGHALLEACKQGHDTLIDKLKDPEIWCAGIVFVVLLFPLSLSLSLSLCLCMLTLPFYVFYG